MEGSDNGTKPKGPTEDNQPRIDIRERIRERDELTPPPEVRAKFILDTIKDHLPEVTNWDLLCFCSEFLGSQVLVYPWLDMNAVADITRIVQQAHYLREEIPETGVINK